jgi:hypothetical protein
MADLRATLEQLVEAHGIGPIRDELDLIEQDQTPYVCPGCYAVGGEPCYPGCVDAEIERDREERRDSDEDDGEELDDG